MGIQNGNLKLRNLRVRLDALQQMNLPITLRAGVCVCVCVRVCVCACVCVCIRESESERVDVHYSSQDCYSFAHMFYRRSERTRNHHPMDVPPLLSLHPADRGTSFSFAYTHTHINTHTHTHTYTHRHTPHAHVLFDILGFLRECFSESDPRTSSGEAAKSKCKGLREG